MNFLRNLKIKNKLLLPVYFQALLLVALGVFFFSIHSLIATLSEHGQARNEAAGAVKNMQVTVNDYLGGAATYDKLDGEYKTVAKGLTKDGVLQDKGRMAAFNGLEDKFKNLDTLFKENIGIEKQVMDLTGFSVQQSNTFLTEISRKLADPRLRASVSNIERLVIAGATVNTTANLRIQVMFLQTKQDLSRGAELVAFLDQAVNNATEDEKKLAGTPFAQLPTKAKEANLKIKELSTQFVANSNKINQDKKEILDTYNSLLQHLIRLESEETAVVLSTVRNFFIILLLVSAVITLIGIGLSLAVSRWIVRPILEMTERAYDLAVDDVDMTRRLTVHHKDEIGELAEWFNKFLERLHQLVQKVKDSSGAVHNATDEISRSSEDLATRTNQQSSAITETSTTLESFTSIVQQNTENSAEADMMLTSFNEDIQERKVLIENVTNTMTEIFDSSNQIDNIIKVINDISFQTNLLALNAAVEAARAGEAGRGFAVVASEVRNLAQKTAESSKTIQEIVVRNVETTEKGMKLVQDTSAFFAEIVNMMGETVEKISRITNASREQSTGIEQINTAISHMDETSAQNAGLVQELFDTGRSVQQSAVELQQLVAQFKTDTDTDGDIKGSDYFNEVKKKKVKEKAKKKDKKKDKKKVEKKDKKTPKPAAAAPAPAPADDTPPIEDDFFGGAEDFEEF